MRFFVIIVLISLIYQSSQDQNLSSNPKPFFSVPLESSNPSINTIASESNQNVSTKPGPFTRILNWFKKPANKQNSNENEDFDNQLPSESTDRMINDAISERILEESRPQQLVSGSSPFIEDNSHDHHSSASELKSQIVHPSSSNRNGYGKSASQQLGDKLPLTEALRIVNSANLTDCVARIICELSCNANAYGNEGRIVFRNLIKVQMDQSLKGDDAKFFKQAAAKGRQLVQSKRNCGECFTIYPNCKSDSKDLVTVSSIFKL